MQQLTISISCCASDLNIVGIIDQAVEKLFQLVLTNQNHVLSSLLPDKADQCYYLRGRRHDRQLVDKRNKFFSNSFMIRMLYTDCYRFVYRYNLCSDSF